jgi:hypothetical protein
MSTADTFFSCRETPVYFPSGLLVTDISGSPITKVRLNSQLAGPGNITGPFDGFYYNINENPTTSLYYNGIMYNLVDSIMSFPGVHTIVGFSKPCDAELILTFQTSQPNVLSLPKILLCVAVQSGVRMTATSKKYFSTLTTGASAGRPTLAAVLPKDVPYLEYQGFDVSLLYGGAKCSALPQARTNIAQYLVCQWPIGMTIADFQRFRAEIPMDTPAPGSGIAPKQLTLPPTPVSDLTRKRFLGQVTRLNNVVLEGAGVAPPPTIKKGEKGIPVPSMKCQPVKFKGAEGKLTMDMTGKKLTTSLKEELEDSSAELEDGPGQCKNIGNWEIGMATILGVMVGIILCSVIMYYVLEFIYSDYSTKALQKFTAPSNIHLALPTFPSLPTICKD